VTYRGLQHNKRIKWRSVYVCTIRRITIVINRTLRRWSRESIVDWKDWRVKKVNIFGDFKFQFRRWSGSYNIKKESDDWYLTNELWTWFDGTDINLPEQWVNLSRNRLVWQHLGIIETVHNIEQRANWWRRPFEEPIARKRNGWDLWDCVQNDEKEESTHQLTTSLLTEKAFLTKNTYVLIKNLCL